MVWLASPWGLNSLNSWGLPLRAEWAGVVAKSTGVRDSGAYPPGTLAQSGPLIATSVPRLIPTPECLALHHQHAVYESFDEFQPRLEDLLKQGEQLAECEQAIKTLGIIEPLTCHHLPPETLAITPPNYRESIISSGCLSRNRATLVVLESLYRSIEQLNAKRIYLAEDVTGFAMWAKRHFSDLATSEYVDSDVDSNGAANDYHQDLCNLSFGSGIFDLVICNEVFEHVYDLDLALAEIARTLTPGGRLLATFPMAFGQINGITKAKWNKVSEKPEIIGEPDFHGDPIRPNEGSLVYQVPGWEILNKASAVGFQHCAIHAVASWKHGVLGGDLPGVLVMEAIR